MFRGSGFRLRVFDGDSKKKITHIGTTTKMGKSACQSCFPPPPKPSRLVHHIDPTPSSKKYLEKQDGQDCKPILPKDRL